MPFVMSAPAFTTPQLTTDSTIWGQGISIKKYVVLICDSRSRWIVIFQEPWLSGGDTRVLGDSTPHDLPRQLHCPELHCSSGNGQFCSSAVNVSLEDRSTVSSGVAVAQKFYLLLYPCRPNLGVSGAGGKGVGPLNSLKLPTCRCLKTRLKN